MRHCTVTVGACVPGSESGSLAPDRAGAGSEARDQPPAGRASLRLRPGADPPPGPGPAIKYRAFRARPARRWRPGPSESGGTERHTSHTTRNVELIVSSEALVLSFGYRPRPLAPHASAGESRSAAAPRLNSFKLRLRHSGSGPRLHHWQHWQAGYAWPGPAGHPPARRRR